MVDHATAECLGIHVAKRGTRFEALKPIREELEKHWEAKRREQEEAERRHQAQFRAGLLLSHLGDYLQRHKHVKFDGLVDLWKTSDKLAELLRPKLVEIILHEPDISDEKLRRHIEQWADEKLGVVAGTQGKQGERKRALR